MESNFRVWNFSIWRTIAHVLVIVTPCIAFGAVQIDIPSSIEAKTPPPRNERAEILNGGLQGCKASAKECVDVVGPRSVGWVDRAKLCQDGGTKCSASVSATSLEVVAPKEVSANGSRQKSSGDGGEVSNEIFDQIFQGVLLGIFIAWPIMWLGDAGPYGGMKPNVKLRGAALLRRPARTPGWAIRIHLPLPISFEIC